MPIGKDSITKRVAKPANTEAATAPKKTTAKKEENVAPELVATVAAAPKKAPAKKTSTSSAKKPAAKKPEAEKKVETTVLANVAPETVAAVIGHEENKGFEKVQVGEKMPVHLL
jgi:hypothetical protein